MSHKKPHVQDRLDRAQTRLSARLESLKAKEMTDAQIKRDPKVRQIQAEVRKAKMQLANIAKNEKQVAQQAEAKAQKLAEPKSAAPKKSKSAGPKKKKVAEAPAKKKTKKKAKKK